GVCRNPLELWYVGGHGLQHAPPSLWVSLLHERNHRRQVLTVPVEVRARRRHAWLTERKRAQLVYAHAAQSVGEVAKQTVNAHGRDKKAGPGMLIHVFEESRRPEWVL